MKKSLTIIIIIVILTLSITFYFLKNNSSQKIISQEELIEIIQPEIDSYCETLETKASDIYQQDTNPHCPTCSHNDPEYEILQTDNGYSITAKIYLIYHWRNDQSEENTATFIIDNNKEIIEANIPKKECK